MSQRIAIKRSQVDESATLINGGIFIALGVSMFILNAWQHIAVRTGLGLAWGLFFLLLKGPELLRLIKRSK